METVKSLIDKLNLLLKQGKINEDDVISIIGSGEKESDLLEGIIFPKMKPRLSDKKGFSFLAITNKKDIDDN